MSDKKPKFPPRAFFFDDAQRRYDATGDPNPPKKKIIIKRDPKGVKATIKDIPLYSATMRTQNIGSITIPTTTQNVNPAQVGVFSAKSIPSKGGSNGGGGGSGGSGGGGGGGGRGFGGGGYSEANKKPKPYSGANREANKRPKEQRKKQREAQQPKGERKSGMGRAKVRALSRSKKETLGANKKGSTAKQKPKRDITKITTPKPKEKVKSASGTIQKKVGGGKVRATEQTRPQAKSRIQGETTTTYGRKSRMRGERTTIR